MPLPTRLKLFPTTPPVELAHAPVNVAVPEMWRAQLYRPALEEAMLAFENYGRQYPQVAAALGARVLIERLAAVLDDYVAPGVIADINAFVGTRFPGADITEATYLQYVAACLQAEGDPYQLSAIAAPPPPSSPTWIGIEAFFHRYPLIRYMLSVMAGQYVNSVLRCCDRLIEDWTDIGLFFFNGTALQSLTGLQGTGSDFHKGGQQVFLLTLRIAGPATRRLVYKPSDVERDFRVVGDSVSLGAVINNFTSVNHKGVTQGNLLNNATNNGASLVEMVTAFAAQDQVTVPVTKYRILPVYPGTSLAAQNGAYNIRQSYGWLEFLSYEQADRDCQDENQRSSYYQTYGAFVGLTYLFQITDMHQENVIVHALQPYLIDLEMAYPGIMASPNEIGLQGAYGRFTVPVLARVVDGWNSPHLTYDLPGTTEPTKNRPYYQGNPYTPDGNDAAVVGALFLRTINLVIAHQNAFDGWMVAASGGISRLVPFGTGNLLERLRAIHDPAPADPDDRRFAPIGAFRPDEVLLRTQDFVRRDQANQGGMVGWGDQFILGANNPQNAYDLALTYAGIQPRFAYWLHPQTAEDFKSGDVPAFYQKTNTGVSLDSRGAPIAVSFDRAIQLMPVANDQATLSASLRTVWNTATLLPSTYFPGSVATVQRAYLAQMTNNAGFRNGRLIAGQQQIGAWQAV